jgi:hypothetical protein
VNWPTKVVKRRALYVSGWIIATGLLAVCARTIDWSHASRTMATANLGWIAAGVLANTLILLIWGLFWRALVPPTEPSVGYKRMFEIVSVSSSLMNTVPFGGGHASSVVLLNRRAGISARGALSVLALDQLGEGLTKVGTFLLVALLAPLPTWMRASVTTVSIVVAVWLVVIVVGSRWAHELSVVKRPRALVALGCAIAMKGVEGLAIAAVQHAFGVSLPVNGTLLVLAAVLLGTMLPIAPGNLGTYEASAFLAYRHLGLSAEQSLGLAVAQHVCFMLPAVGVGYGFLSARSFSAARGEAGS